jgi:polyferredoxin
LSLLPFLVLGVFLVTLFISQQNPYRLLLDNNKQFKAGTNELTWLTAFGLFWLYFFGVFNEFVWVPLSVFVFRVQCRYYCPIGALLRFIGFFSLGRTRLPANCSHCGLAERKCRVNALQCPDKDTSRLGIVDKSRCFGCGECLTACPDPGVTVEYGPPRAWREISGLSLAGTPSRAQRGRPRRLSATAVTAARIVLVVFALGLWISAIFISPYSLYNVVIMATYLGLAARLTIAIGQWLNKKRRRAGFSLVTDNSVGA